MKIKPLHKRLQSPTKQAGDAEIAEGQFIEIKGYTLDSDPSPVVTQGLLLVLFGFGGFLLWAMLAPLDQGVVAQGVVNVDTKRKTVQHLRGGIVDKILVRDGTKVKKGDPLILLNDTQAKAELGIVKGQYLAARASETRLLAERDKQDHINFPNDLMAEKSDPIVAELMRVQNDLFHARRATLLGAIAIYQQSVAGLQDQINGLQSIEKSAEQQMSLLNEELASLRTLFAQGYVPRTRLFDLERSLANITGSRGEALSNIEKSRNSIREMKLRILQQQQEFDKEVGAELEEIRREVAAQRERYVAAQDSLDRSVIESPTDGVIVGSSIYTVGGVISPGQELMYVVPEGDALLIETQVMPQDIDKVQKGLLADVRLTAFNQSTTPVVQGTVVMVSADRTVDERTGVPYFAAKVAITEEGLKKLEKLQIQPGMPADVIIKTGERTFMGYLLKPLFDRVARSFKEE